MKRTLLALLLCVGAGSVLAEEQMLAPVVVERANGTRLIVDCAPPNAARECGNFHELIRMNFSPREIGMLFGAATAYQEYPSGYDQVRARYAAFLRDIEDNGLPVVVADTYSESEDY
jgi:hypothetical protein